MILKFFKQNVRIQCNEASCVYPAPAHSVLCQLGSHWPWSKGQQESWRHLKVLFQTFAHTLSFAHVQTHAPNIKLRMSEVIEKAKAVAKHVDRAKEQIDRHSTIFPPEREATVETIHPFLRCLPLMKIVRIWNSSVIHLCTSTCTGCPSSEHIVTITLDLKA